MNGVKEGQEVSSTGESSVEANGTIAGFQNVQAEDSSAYLNNYKAHSKGISHEEMVQAYTEWADRYDDVSFGQLRCPVFNAADLRGKMLGCGRVGVLLNAERPILSSLWLTRKNAGRDGKEQAPPSDSSPVTGLKNWLRRESWNYSVMMCLSAASRISVMDVTMDLPLREMLWQIFSHLKIEPPFES